MFDPRFTTTDLYDHDVIIVKRMGSIDKICYCNSIRKSGFEERNKEKKSKGSVNESKLKNNIIRARNSVKEYALCNPWDYFVTITLNPKFYDRYDLEKYKKDLSKFINNYNRNGKNICYLLIPEQHNDGAWHMHGLLSGLKPNDIYLNEYGYLSWKQYDKKFGFINIEPIKDIQKCATYISKYITKDLAESVSKLNAHLYYASKGLKKADKIYQGHASLIGNYDWESDDGNYKIKSIDNRICDFKEFLITYDD